MLVHFSRREYRCQPGLHRPGCGGSTPPSCRVWVASIAAMQRSLKPQSTGQHRGDPPSYVSSCEFRVSSCQAIEPETPNAKLETDSRRCGSAATAAVS